MRNLTVSAALLKLFTVLIFASFVLPASTSTMSTALATEYGKKKKGGINAGKILLGVGAAVATYCLQNPGKCKNDKNKNKNKTKNKPNKNKTITRNCSKPLVRSKRGKCVCPTWKGYKWSRGKCRKHNKPKDDGPNIEVTRVQECLIKIGYLEGNADGVMGRKSNNALRQFHEENAPENTRPNLSDRKTIELLFNICGEPQDHSPPTIVTSPEVVPTANTPDEPTQPAPYSPNPQLAGPDNVSPKNCLPDDLYDKLQSAYGKKTELSKCDNACLPKPETMGEGEIQSLSAKHNINWCNSCIKLASFVPLADILKIETLAGVTLCATAPQNQCFLPTTNTVVKTYPKVRTLFRRLPVSIGNEGDIAVIIGNDNYNGVLPVKHNGQRNAGAIHTLLTEQLGFKDKNIIDLRNATRAEFVEIFGTEENAKGKLAKMVETRRRSDIFIYVSAHGLTDQYSEQSYLLPTNAEMDRLNETAYPLPLLYKNLGTIDAGSIMLLLEAGFSANLSDPSNPNLPENEVKVLPPAPVPGLAVFTAADRDQKPLDDPEYGIGLFTRFMIEGLAGKADEAPLGNADRRVDTVELYVYAANQVRMAARKSLGMEQKPQILNPENVVVGRLASN